MSGLSKSMRAILDREACVQAGVEAHYDLLVDNGADSGFAAMLALRQPPGVRGSDRTFMNDSDVRHHGLGDAAPWIQEMIVAKARGAGINITGKVYKSGLADTRGPADPEAWVDGLGDVKRVAEKRNLNVEGAINVKGHQVPPKPAVALNERIVREKVAHYRRVDPSWRHKPVQELREFVIDRHGAKDVKKPDPKPKKKILSVA